MPNRHEIPGAIRPTRINRTGRLVATALAVGGGIGAAVGVGATLGVQQLTKPKQAVEVTYGPNTSPTDAAMAIEVLQGVKHPDMRSAATQNLKTSITSSILDNPNVPRVADVQGGGEEPIITAGQTFTFDIPTGNYPAYEKYSDHNGTVELRLPDKPNN